MAPYFTVTVDPAISLVHITIGGFFQPADVARLVRQRDEAHRLLRCPTNDHVTLVDMRDMDIHSQDAMLAFRGALTSPLARSRRLAFVTGKTLARMQIERVAEGRAGMFFTDVADARAWLLSPAQQAA